MPFTPQSLPEASGTLIAHWAARLESYNDDDAVATFNAQSGTTRDADQSTEADKPTFKTNIINGQSVFRFDGTDFMESGAVSDWKFLHDDSEFTIFVVAATASANPNAVMSLLDTTGLASANVGLSFAFDDRVSQTSEARVRGFITRGVSGQPVASFGTDYGAILGEFEILEFMHETGEADDDWQIFNNLALVSSQASNDFAPSTADSTYVLNIGRFGSGVGYLTGDIAEILIYTGNLSVNDRTYVRDNLVSLYYGVSVPRTYARIQSSPTDYDAFSIGFFDTQNIVQIIGRRGTTHGEDNGEIRRWYSDDFGVSWSSETVVDDATYDDRNSGGDMIAATGRIVFFYNRYNFGGSISIDIRYLISDDFGANWTDMGTIDIGSDTTFAPYGAMIALPSGKLMQTFYGNDGTNHRLFVQFSTDDGETWAGEVEIENDTVIEATEGCAVHLTGVTDGTAVLLVVTRDNNGVLRQYKSTNGGATWASQGVLPFSIGVGRDVSPWLFRTGDTVYLAYMDRTRNKMMLAWGDKDLVDDSVNNWIGPHIVFSSLAPVPEAGHSGYPSMFLVAGSLVMIFYDGTNTSDPDFLFSDINTEYMGPFATSKIV